MMAALEGFGPMRRKMRKIASFSTRKNLVLLSTAAKLYLSNKDRASPMRDLDVLLIALPLSSTTQPPLGIAALKSYLGKEGITCACIDFNMRLCTFLGKHRHYRYDDLEKIFPDKISYAKFEEDVFLSLCHEWSASIASAAPKMVGLSVSSFMTYPALRTFVGALRSHAPHIPIVLGGLASKNKAIEFIREGYGDVVVKGEGEIAFTKVVRALKNGKNDSAREQLGRIPGIAYKDSREDIRDNGEPEQVKNLDELPCPNFDDFQLTLYRYPSSILPVLPIMGSRSCPWSCDFCNIPHLWKSFRHRSAQSIFKEMMHQKERYGTRSFSFTDSLINSRPSMLEELCDLIIESKETFIWGGSYRIWPKPSPPHFMQKLAEAGCMRLNIGIESGSERVRAEMDKHFSNDVLIQELMHMSESGIDTTLMFIIGHPAETMDDFNQTLDFISQSSSLASRVNLIPCLILANTPLWEKMRRYGITFDENGEWRSDTSTIGERMRRLSIANQLVEGSGTLTNSIILNENIRTIKPLATAAR
jgi:hypothetical protein